MKEKSKKKLFLLKENVAILRNSNSIFGGNSNTCGGETTTEPDDEGRVKVYKCIEKKSKVWSWSYPDPKVEE